MPKIMKNSANKKSSKIFVLRPEKSSKFFFDMPTPRKLGGGRRTIKT